MWHGICQRGPGDPGADVPPRYGRFRQLGGEFGKFAVIGGTGVIITNAVYDLLFLHLGAGPVTSTTIATAVAAIATYLGNRYWSFRARQRTGVVHEIVVFAVLNGIGLLIQDAAVGFNYYLLHLGHNKLAGLVALNAGIALATLFRFWSYRRFVWVTSRGTPDDGRKNDALRPLRRRSPRIRDNPAGHPRAVDQLPGHGCLFRHHLEYGGRLLVLSGCPDAPDHPVPLQQRPG
jgi:putative flippase GtrA